MKNLSIRTRILAAIVVMNLIGALVVVVYLHQSYSGGLDVAAEHSVNQSTAAWNDITGHDAPDGLSVETLQANGAGYVDRMKAITGADYGLLLDKNAIDETMYAQVREASNVANNWDERDVYVLAASTDEATAERMQMGASADSVPEIGRLVGIENGSCTKTCHGAVKGEGDFWAVSWSDDSTSRAHTVFPVVNSGGEPLGLVYSIENISGSADAAKGSLLRTLLVIGLTLIASTIVIGGVLDSLVFKRLNRMVASIEDISIRVAGGDFDARFTPDGTTDEIGRFESFFARFMDLVGGTLKSLAG